MKKHGKEAQWYSNAELMFADTSALLAGHVCCGLAVWAFCNSNYGGSEGGREGAPTANAHYGVWGD